MPTWKIDAIDGKKVDYDFKKTLISWVMCKEQFSVWIRKQFRKPIHKYEE